MFTDWSSIDSPRERTSQRNVSARSVDPNITQTDNQADQPRLESARAEAMGNTLSDVMTLPSTHQQLSQVGIRLIDRETNMSEVDLRTQREETRIDILSSNNRTCTMDVIPQLDGPTSARTRRRPEQGSF